MWEHPSGIASAYGEVSSAEIVPGLCPHRRKKLAEQMLIAQGKFPRPGIRDRVRRDGGGFLLDAQK
jgi:hypothetical protein